MDGQQFVTTIPGKIAMPVYRALKRRQLNMPINIKILPTQLAIEHVANLEKKQKSLNSIGTKNDEEQIEINCFTQEEFDPIPSIDTEYISVIISYVSISVTITIRGFI